MEVKEYFVLLFLKYRIEEWKIVENNENGKNGKKLGIGKWEIMRMGMWRGNQSFGLDKLSVRLLLIFKIYLIK